MLRRTRDTQPTAHIAHVAWSRRHSAWRTAKTHASLGQPHNNEHIRHSIHAGHDQAHNKIVGLALNGTGMARNAVYLVDSWWTR